MAAVARGDAAPVDQRAPGRRDRPRSQPVASCGAKRVHPVDRRRGGTTTRGSRRSSSSPRSPAGATTASATVSGSVEVALVGPVLDLDVHHAVGRRRRGPRRAAAAMAGSSLGAGASTMRRPSGRTASWCTTPAPSAVRRTSSSTPSAPHRDRAGEGRDGVLGVERPTRPGGRGRGMAKASFLTPEKVLAGVSGSGGTVSNAAARACLRRNGTATACEARHKIPTS